MAVNRIDIDGASGVVLAEESAPWAHPGAGAVATINGLVVFLVLEGVVTLTVIRGPEWPALLMFAALQVLLVADAHGLRGWLDLPDHAPEEVAARLRGGLVLNLFFAVGLMVLALRWRAGTAAGLDPRWAVFLPAAVSMMAALVTFGVRSRPTLWAAAASVAGVQFLGAIWPAAKADDAGMVALANGLWLGGLLALVLTGLRQWRAPRA